VALKKMVKQSEKLLTLVRFGLFAALLAVFFLLRFLAFLLLFEKALEALRCLSWLFVILGEEDALLLEPIVETLVPEEAASEQSDPAVVLLELGSERHSFGQVLLLVHVPIALHAEGAHRDSASFTKSLAEVCGKH
jgi:hypothetical protein